MTTNFFDQPLQNIPLNKYCLFKILKSRKQVNSSTSKRHEIKTIRMQNKISTDFYSCEIANFKYNNIYLRKCSFVKMIYGISLVVKKEHKLPFLRVDLEIVNDYII